MTLKKFDKDFDYLVINTPSAWRQGKATSLSVDNQEQLVLVSKESIPLQIEISNSIKEIDASWAAFDRNNCLYVIDQNNCELFRYSRKSQGFENIGCKKIDFHNDQATDTHSYLKANNIKCSRIAFSKSSLYVLDSENARIHSFFYPSFQHRFTIGSCEDQHANYINEKAIFLKNPKEILTDQKGNLIVLDTGNKKIFVISEHGFLLQTFEFNQNDLCHPQNPLAIAISLSESLYVLDAGSSSSLNSIQKRDVNQNKWVKIADFFACDTQHQSFSLAVDKNNIINIVSGEAKNILQFTETGKYFGSIEIEGKCDQLIVDRKGEVYSLCGEVNKKIFKFGSNTQFATKGSYLSKVLDSKIFQCSWHRLLLDVTIPDKTQLQVYYYASDEKIVPDEVESTQRWQSFLNNANNKIKDALFENAIGQYLVLKFEFSSDGNDTPRVRMAQVYFQRNSYLRFLPAVYQEDARGKDFLERFLSLYESMFLEVEEKINRITQYFDADATEKEFLDWLSSWLAVMVDENWPEPKRRTLLKEAFELYKYRGTQKTLRRVIEIFTGGEVAIIEHWRLRPPMVLHQSSIVGVSTFVGKKRTQRLILEEYSRIGEFVLEENEDAPEKPFAHDAYDFTVLVDTSRLTEGDIKTLKRLIDDEKPAHTRYFLRTTQGAVAQLGKQSLLGVNTVLSDGFKPMHLGENAKIGKSTIIGTEYSTKGMIGAKSRVAIDTVLH